MWVYLTSFALLLHLLFWGAGLALWLTPRRWARYWPVWVAPAGIALQSVVVWLGAHARWPGTDAYAWWSELLPLTLLVTGWIWRKPRPALRDLARFGVLGAVMAGCLVLLAVPVERATKQLTTVSLGSCDAADYAAGARVFKEFASTDRAGFIGLTEVVRVGSVDNFFDFWLKLNHFTPSALIAFNGSILGLQPWQLTGLLALALVVLTQPLVFWLARTEFRLSERAALWLAFIYGISPICWYGAYHVAAAQLVAAMGIGLMTWCGLRMWRERSRVGWSYFGLLALGGALIWGGYNFIVVVGLVPAVACVGGWALAANELRSLGLWLWRVLAPLGLTGIVFTERVTGLTERFSLFQQTDFGWKIPMLMPEGWLGIVYGTGLEASKNHWAWLLGLAVIALLTIAWVRLLMRDGRDAWRMIACLAPVLVGYGYLQWCGWRLNNNASYDAYKLFAVFYPVLLVALSPWLRWLRDGGGWRWSAVAMLVVVTVGNVSVLGKFATRMSQGVLVVEPELAEVKQVEAMPEVRSVNMRVKNLWPRLWANSLLLRKEQYFAEATYEGRVKTPQRGEWDLNGGLLQVKIPGENWIKINRRYSLTRVDSPYYLRAKLGEGWYDSEVHRARRTVWWRWTKGWADLKLENPHNRPLRVALHFQARGLLDRDIQVWLGSQRLAQALVEDEITDVLVPDIMVPPGQVTLKLKSDMPPVRANATDSRLLGFAAYSIVVEVLPDDT